MTRPSAASLSIEPRSRRPRCGNRRKPWAGSGPSRSPGKGGSSTSTSLPPVAAARSSPAWRRPWWNGADSDLDRSTSSSPWADRVAITGPNGGGKTTLLAALLGRLPLAQGRRWLGPSVVVGELDQHRARLDASKDLLAGFSAATGVLPESARSTLAKFGLGAGHVHRRPAALSPGERTRALLAALMASGTNCLVFDEPTNHLDLPAIEALEVALERFEGTLLVVSHDRWLLESLTVNRTWVVEGGQVHEGSVSSPPG